MADTKTVKPIITKEVMKMWHFSDLNITKKDGKQEKSITCKRPISQNFVFLERRPSNVVKDSCVKNKSDFNITEVVNLKMTVCRICLKQGTISIHGDNFSEDLAGAISICGGIDISIFDPYPKYLCEYCHTLLQRAILFRESAQSTDLLLKKSAISELNIGDSTSDVKDVDKDADNSSLTTQIDSGTSIDKAMEPDFEEKYNDSFMDMNIVVPTTETQDSLKVVEVSVNIFKGPTPSVNASDNKSVKNEKLPRKKCKLVLKCEQCNIQFGSVLDYQNHNLYTKTHNKKMCEVCKQTYASRFTQTHNSTTKKMESMFVCEICYKNINNVLNKNKNLFKDIALQQANKSLKQQKVVSSCTQLDIEFDEIQEDKKNIMLHKIKCEKEMCEVCKQSYGVQYTQTYNPTTQKTDSMFVCDICYRNVNNVLNVNEKKCSFKEIALQQENKALNQKNMVLSCTQLDIEFDEIQEDKKDRQHTIKCKKEMCEICKQNYAVHYTQNPTTKMLRSTCDICYTSLQKSEWQCDHCNLSLSTSLEYSKHKLTHSKDMKMCPICKKSYMVKFLNRHIKTHQTDSQNANIPKKCEHCNLTFCTSQECKNHKLTHAEEMKTCPTCKNSFKIGFLKIHMQTHKRTSLCLCDICGKNILRRNIGAHLRTHGPQEKLPYKCPVCSKTILKASLKIHMRIHTGERPYACDECPKKFVHKGNLIIHKYIHKKDFAFKCECGKGYHTKKMLVSHVKAVHIGIKEHVCQTCGIGYGYRRGLARHQRRAHKIVKCTEGNRLFKD